MNLGGPEILVIIVIALLVLGPDKLPNALRMIGRVMGEIKKYQDLAKTEINKAMNSTQEHSDSSSATDDQTSNVNNEPMQEVVDTHQSQDSSISDEPHNDIKNSVAPIVDEDE